MNKILIADDEQMITSLLEESLLRQIKNIEIETAKNGFEAAVSLKKSLPDLIISDYNMPGATGVEVLELALKLDYSNGIILMSGDFGGLNQEINQRNIQYDKLSLLAKPFNLAELTDLVRKYIQNKSKN